MACLAEAWKLLSTGGDDGKRGGGGKVMAMDDLLPLLFLVVARAAPLHLASDAAYVREFSLAAEAQVSGMGMDSELQFQLTNIEASAGT